MKTYNLNKTPKIFICLGDDIVSCQLDTDTSPVILKDYVLDCAKVVLEKYNKSIWKLIFKF